MLSAAADFVQACSPVFADVLAAAAAAMAAAMAVVGLQAVLDSVAIFCHWVLPSQLLFQMLGIPLAHR
jgi:hypothetical protein